MAASTHLVVDKEPHLFLGVLQAQQPQEKQGEEWRGLLNEHTNQDDGESFILQREGQNKSQTGSSHCLPPSPYHSTRKLDMEAPWPWEARCPPGHRTSKQTRQAGGWQDSW